MLVKHRTPPKRFINILQQFLNYLAKGQTNAGRNILSLVEVIRIIRE